MQPKDLCKDISNFIDSIDNTEPIMKLPMVEIPKGLTFEQYEKLLQEYIKADLDV